MADKIIPPKRAAALGGVSLGEFMGELGKIFKRFGYSCVPDDTSKVLVNQDGTRKAVESPSGAWQLLDGQQRINALRCIFTDKGRFRRFLVDMFALRYPARRLPLGNVLTVIVGKVLDIHMA